MLLVLPIVLCTTLERPWPSAAEAIETCATRSRLSHLYPTYVFCWGNEARPCVRRRIWVLTAIDVGLLVSIIGEAFANRFLGCSVLNRSTQANPLPCAKPTYLTPNGQSTWIHPTRTRNAALPAFQIPLSLQPVPGS